MQTIYLVIEEKLKSLNKYDPTNVIAATTDKTVAEQTVAILNAVSSNSHAERYIIREVPHVTGETMQQFISRF